MPRHSVRGFPPDRFRGWRGRGDASRSLGANGGRRLMLDLGVVPHGQSRVSAAQGRNRRSLGMRGGPFLSLRDALRQTTWARRPFDAGPLQGRACSRTTPVCSRSSDAFIEISGSRERRRRTISCAPVAPRERRVSFQGRPSGPRLGGCGRLAPARLSAMAILKSNLR